MTILAQVFVIIWWLFDDYPVLIIWWLFDDYLFSIIRDYLISTPAADMLASFISRSLSTALWHSLVMAACARGHIAACELQQEPPIVSNYYLFSLACFESFDLPSALPSSARSVFLREVAVPAVTQYLLVTGAHHLLCLCVFSPLSLRDVSILTWNNENKHKHCNNHNKQ